MLNRFDGNVVPFASEATLTNRTVFGAETQSDDIDDNLNADFKKGWEIVRLNDNPTREDFNAMGYTLGNLISYLYQNGVAEYNALQEYKTNSIAIATDGSIYQSLIDVNIGNALTDTTKWVCIASKNSIVNSIAELKTISNIESINVLGYYEKGDGGGGTFYWDSASTESDNGGDTIQATGINPGRWKRPKDEIVDVRKYGAKGDGVTDDTIALLKYSSFNNTILTEGTYITNSQLVFNGGNHKFLDNAIIKAGASFPANTDIVVVEGGETYKKTILDDIVVDCNRKGRDGIVIKNGDHSSVKCKVSNSQRDGVAIVCSGYDWVENLDADISAINNGRNGVRFEIESGAIGSFINESTFNIEVRGVSQTTNGGVGIYGINNGTIAGTHKISNLNFPNINLDAAAGIATANGFTVGYTPIYLDYSATGVNVFEKWYMNCGGFESTSGTKPIDSVNGLSNYFMYAANNVNTTNFDVIGSLSYNWGDGYLKLNGDTHRYKSSKDYGDNGIYSAMYPANTDQRILTIGKERKSLTRSTSSTEVDGATTVNYVNYNIPYGTNTTVSGTKVGLKFTGASVGSVNKDALTKSAAIYWVNEDSGSAYNRAVGMCIYTSATDQNYREVVRFGSDGHTKPPVTNVHNLGDSSLRWSNIYLVNAPNVSSDERLKTFYDIEESEILVAKELKSMARKYKLNASIIEKGEDKARFHFGVSAQEVVSVFEKYGLNAFNYSLVCKDIINAVYEQILVKEAVTGENGEIIEEAIYKNGKLIAKEDYILSIRYEELLMFIMISQ